MKYGAMELEHCHILKLSLVSFERNNNYLHHVVNEGKRLIRVLGVNLISLSSSYAVRILQKC